MNWQTDDDKLISTLQAEFRESLADVSEIDRARLRRARREALSIPTAGHGLTGRRTWRSLALAASLALLALVLLPISTDRGPVTDGSRVADSGSQVSDLEILLAEEELGFYENLDFYLWIEAALPRERGNGN
jgi:hypothetical protein